MRKPQQVARTLRRMGAGRTIALGIATVVLTPGCGPSPRRVHYADMHFERCAAADAAGGAPRGERRACWEGWLDHHTLGQPPEKVRYARDRLVFLSTANGGDDDAASRSPQDPTTRDGDDDQVFRGTEGSDGDPDGRVAAAVPGAEGGPQTAGTTPEDPARVPEIEARPTRRRASGGTGVDRSPPPPPANRVGICAGQCAPTWHDCIAECPADRDTPCFEACRSAYFICVRACP